MSNGNTYIGTSALTSIFNGTTRIDWGYGGRNPVWLTNNEDSQNYACIYIPTGTTLQVLNNTKGVISMELDNVPIPISTSITTTSNIVNLKIVVDNNEADALFSGVDCLSSVDCRNNYINVFQNSGLKTVSFHNENTRIQKPFPRSLEKINGLEHVVYITGNAFSGSNITEFVWNPYSPAFFGWEFGRDCFYATAITLGNNVMGATNSHGKLPNNSFLIDHTGYPCVLKNITIGSGITNINPNAFGSLYEYGETIETITLNSPTWTVLNSTNPTYPCFHSLAYNGVINVPTGITGTPWTEYPNEQFANKNWTINYI